ncbi:uncharacterized protein [Aegilops tauschii subsp. strangulata]|uniref:uncharacterized protein n=1 Tax=Aegilops tauschii subsp. strangulata TaxID=200361 RepID=UPI003CC8D136
MALSEEFFVGSIDLARLDFGIITLIPKVTGASDIRQFRPITVINVIFRILARGYALRVAPIADGITHPDQSAFIQGQYIFDGVLVFHEALHEVHSKHLKAVFLKLDFHKAYDTVSWPFLRECLLRKGFNDRWVSRVMQMVSSGRTAVNINGEVGPFFPTSCGMCQGDPFSPFLFNMVVDALAAILDKAKAAGHIKGSATDIMNLKFLLICFQQMSGLGINFNKSVLLPILRIGTLIAVGSGTSTMFWFHRWAGDLPLAARFPYLFSIAVDPRISVATTLIDLGQLAFRRAFGLPENADWHELLECIALHEPDLEVGEDRARWRLEPSEQFSTKSLYQAITASLGHEWIRGCLPSGVEVLKRNGPGDGRCPLCGPEEDLNHIFFTCLSAQFLWSCFREIVGGSRDHNNFPALFAELQASAPSIRHIRWLIIGVLTWTLWTVRNKLLIQRIPFRRATDALFKWSG